MWEGMSSQERRYLWTGAGSALGLVVALVCLWASPLSPVSLDNSALQAASGSPADAVEAYLDQSQGWGTDQNKGEALWRAAVLSQVELTDPAQAGRIIEDLITRFPGHIRVAEAHARMAWIHSVHHRDPVQAGIRWVAAAAVNPRHPQAGRWMLDAGLAFADAGDTGRAMLALAQAATRPDQVVAARLAQGRMRLSADPAQAYVDYDAAFRAGATGEDRRLARLGMATALEHLDRREQALAELEEAAEEGMSDAALRRRRQRLRARRNP
jgi:hypothetical protein